MLLFLRWRIADEEHATAERELDSGTRAAAVAETAVQAARRDREAAEAAMPPLRDEEAAGISGLYQRRHEAELKLSAAGTNLGRVAEVIEQLDTQLRSLERQAAQARRYRAIAEELRQIGRAHV